MNEDKNAINGQLDSINNNLTKLEKHSLRIRDNTGMIWLTLVLYVVYVEGFLRWSLRVNAYVFLLTTDEYPPFRLRE